MNRKERRAMKSQQRHAHDSEELNAVENKITDAIEQADLVVYINPHLPRLKVHIERSLI